MYMMAVVENNKQAESARRMARSLQGLVDDPNLTVVLNNFDDHVDGILNQGLKTGCWNLACQDRTSKRDAVLLALANYAIKKLESVTGRDDAVSAAMSEINKETSSLYSRTAGDMGAQFVLGCLLYGNTGIIALGLFGALAAGVAFGPFVPVVMAGAALGGVAGFAYGEWIAAVTTYLNAVPVVENTGEYVESMRMSV